VTVTSLATDGWIVDPFIATPPTIIVQQAIIGTIAPDDELTGTLAADDALAGTLESAGSFTGTLTIDLLTGTIDAADELTGTLACEGETMTDIEMPRGDSRSFQLTILQSDAVTPVDLSDAILRFAVKERYGQENVAAKVFKTSYLADEVLITNAVNGECTVELRIADTVGIEPGVYVWEVELTRKGVLVTSAGTLAFTAGSSVAQGSGLDFSSLRIGQYIEPAGGVGNNVPVLVTALDETGATVSFEGYNGFATESGVTFNAYEGDRKTPSGLSGKFTLCPDVVR